MALWVAAFVQAWHTFPKPMHMQQIWHVVKEILANPFVQGILLVSGIIGAVKNGWMVFKACQKFLSFIKETALGLLGLVLIIRSPQRYLVAPLLPFAVRLTFFFILAWWFYRCLTYSRIGSKVTGSTAVV